MDTYLANQNHIINFDADYNTCKLSQTLSAIAFAM